MGTLWNGKGKDFSDVKFTNGTSTQHNYGGETNVLDPNWPDNTTQAAQEPPDHSIPPQPPPEDPGDGPVTPPEVTPPTDPGDGGTEPPTEPPDTGAGVPDYSDEAGDIGGDGDMSYNVPGTPDLEVPDSGTGIPVEQTLWEVTPEQTVAGQLEELYNRDSPFFENARQRAIRQHLASGGQNSAMAAGFGELAAMDTAFKVAFEDARTYARSAEFNAAMANQFSLAEQRFMHNAALSDQAYDQARALQTQRVEAQLESIVLDYKGRSMLMDKELDQWFLKAKQEFAYQMATLDKQADLQMRVNNMQALTSFWVNGFNSVMQIAGNPNLTAEQSRAAMEEGMIWFQRQREAFQSWLNGTSLAGTPNDAQSWASYTNDWTSGSYPQWGYWPQGGTQP